MRVYRLVDRAFLDDAWTGEGSRLHGGRWNQAGLPIVYASDHPALAILEILAGGLRLQDLRHWALLAAEVPDPLITALPAGSDDLARGDSWARSGGLACRVPSRVVDGKNILLNPLSKDWRRVRIIGERPMDKRLWA